MILTRYAYLDNGTYGRFDCDGMELYIVERPWLNNRVRISCIPIGEYRCEPRYYHRGGYGAVEVMNVKDRTHILFHIGNFPANSMGCLLVNSEIVGYPEGLRGVNSRLAFNQFMSVYGQGFDLTIVNYEGGRL